MVSIKTILKDVYDNVKDVCSKTYLQERPESVSPKLNDFLVIRATNGFRNGEIDPRGGYEYYETTIRFEVFVRDKVTDKNPNGIDINTMDTKVSSLINLIPFYTEHLKVTEPRVTISIKDGDGFHVTFIVAELTTLV